MADQHIRLNFAQFIGDFVHGSALVRRIVPERTAGKPRLLNFRQKGLATAVLAEAEEQGLMIGRQRFGEAEHLPLWAAEERGRGDVNDAHATSLSVRGNLIQGEGEV